VKACAIFGSDPAKTYDSAIEILGQEVVAKLQWYRFSGTLDQLVGLRTLINNTGTSGYSLNDVPSDYYAKQGAGFGPSGFMAAAKLFGGKLGATFDAAVEMYGEKFITGLLRWTAFSGSADQYKIIRDKINGGSDGRLAFNDVPSDYYLKLSPGFGPQGSSDMARALQADMGTTYDLTVQIYGEAFVTGKLQWYRFDGDPTAHDKLRRLVNRLVNGYSDVEFNTQPSRDYVRFSKGYGATGLAEASTYFGDDMERTFDSAVQIYNKEFVQRNDTQRGSLDWYRVTKATREQVGSLRTRVNNLSSGYGTVAFDKEPSRDYQRYSPAYGQDNYLKISQELFESELELAYDTAVEVYGRAFVDGLRWQRIPPLPILAVDAKGEEKPIVQVPAIITTLRKRLFANPGSTKPTLIANNVGFEGLIKYAKEHSKGDLGAAVKEIEQNLGAQLITDLQWPSGMSLTVTQVEAVRRELPSDTWFTSKFGYATRYRTGNGLVLTAKEIFGGDVGLTKRAVLLILGPTEFAKLGWE
jgi:hypothetical protein